MIILDKCCQYRSNDYIYHWVFHSRALNLPDVREIEGVVSSPMSTDEGGPDSGSMTAADVTAAAGSALRGTGVGIWAISLCDSNTTGHDLYKDVTTDWIVAALMTNGRSSLADQTTPSPQRWMYSITKSWNVKRMLSFAVVGSIVGLVGTLTAPVILSAIGFSTSGVVASSLAAFIHSYIGNVAAGSTFAMLQGVGAVGGFSMKVFVLSFCGGSATGAAIGTIPGDSKRNELPLTVPDVLRVRLEPEFHMTAEDVATAAGCLSGTGAGIWTIGNYSAARPSFVAATMEDSQCSIRRTDHELHEAEPCAEPVA